MPPPAISPSAAAPKSGVILVSFASSVVKRTRTDALLSSALKGIKEKVDGSSSGALLEVRMQELDERRAERREAVEREWLEREERRKDREAALEREKQRLIDAREQRAHEQRIAELAAKARDEDTKARRDQDRQFNQMMLMALMRMTGSHLPETK